MGGSWSMWRESTQPQVDRANSTQKGLSLDLNPRPTKARRQSYHSNTVQLVHAVIFFTLSSFTFNKTQTSWAWMTPVLNILHEWLCGNVFCHSRHRWFFAGALCWRCCFSCSTVHLKILQLFCWIWGRTHRPQLSLFSFYKNLCLKLLCFGWRKCCPCKASSH